MLEFYRISIEVYNNNEYISTDTRLNLVDDSLVILEEYSQNITNWNTLSEYYKNNGLWLPFTLYDTKRGRRICFFEPRIFNKNTWDIKEWKQKELDIKITYYYTKINPSLDEIYKWKDAEKAHRYLKEHDLL